MMSRRLSPIFIPATPWSQPLMTEPVPSGNLNARPALRELSNCLPLLSAADASYNQPVYSTTAIWPPATAAPVPSFSVTDCSAVTALAGAAAAGALPGGAPGLPLQAASSTNTRRPVLEMLIDAMDGILKDFSAAASNGGAQHHGAHSASGREIAGDAQSAEAHRIQAQR